MAIDSKKHTAALAALLKKADAAYYVEGRRKAVPIMTDAKYDAMRADLTRRDPKNPALRRVGASPKSRDAARRKLPFTVGSMDKCTPEEVGAWCAGVVGVTGPQKLWITTPKLDGLSILAKYVDGEMRSATTRGDGTVGRDVTAAFRHVQGARLRLNECEVPTDGELDVRFECFMHRSIFQRFYAEGAAEGKLPEGFKNSRNLVAGLINRIDVESAIPDLRKCTAAAIELWRHHPKFGWGRPSERHRELLYIASLGLTPVTNPSRYTVGDAKIRRMVRDGHAALKKVLPVLPPSTTLGELVYSAKVPTPEELKARVLKMRAAVDADMDGVVLEPNDNSAFQSRGDHLEARPAFRRAIKLDAYEQDSVMTAVRGLRWEVSKRGLIKPTLFIRPVRLGGVDVTNFTANNAKQVRAWGYRKGVPVKVIRAGDVIPRVIGVRHGGRWIKVDSKALPAKPLGPSDLPKVCPSCRTALRWGSANDLLCPNVKCVGRRTAGIVSFFRELKADDIGPGVASAFVAAGLDDVPKILAGATVPRLMRVKGFAATKAQTVAREVRDCLTDKPLALIMHATGTFAESAFSLGESRLADIVRVLGEDGVATMDVKRIRSRLYGVHGIGNETLEMFVRRLPAWRTLWSSIRKYRKETTRKTLAGKVVAFTGFRDAEMEQYAVTHGAIVAGSVSKKCDVLFAASLGSTKAQKADRYGVPVVKQASAWGWLKRNSK